MSVAFYVTLLHKASRGALRIPVFPPSESISHHILIIQILAVEPYLFRKYSQFYRVTCCNTRRCSEVVSVTPQIARQHRSFTRFALT